MKNSSNPLLVGAAVAGIMSAATLSLAADAKKVKESPMGGCIGANSCKGKSNCHTDDRAGCAGQNSCKGTGWLKMTEAECKQLIKKNKKLYFESFVREDPTKEDEKLEEG